MKTDFGSLSKKWWFWVIAVIILLVFPYLAIGTVLIILVDKKTKWNQVIKILLYVTIALTALVLNFSSCDNGNYNSKENKTTSTATPSTTIKKSDEEKQEEENKDAKSETEEPEKTEPESEQTNEEEKKDSATLGEKNALKKALSYINYSAFSYSGLAKQLEFEGFTNSEAIYGADNCGADWNKQAALKAQDYIDYSSFSRQGLIDQLMYDGFTKEQAEYGTGTVGY